MLQSETKKKPRDTQGTSGNQVTSGCKNTRVASARDVATDILRITDTISTGETNGDHIKPAAFNKDLNTYTSKPKQSASGARDVDFKSKTLNLLPSLPGNLGTLHQPVRGKK